MKFFTTLARRATNPELRQAMRAGLLLTAALGALGLSSVHAEEVGERTQLHREWLTLKAESARIGNEGSMVGGYMHVDDRGDHLLMWSKNEFSDGGHEVLRIFIPASEGQRAFEVSYFLSKHLVVADGGRAVLRRFVGPSVSGWRADTVDWLTGEPVDRQGATFLQLTALEEEVLRRYGIQADLGDL